MYFKEREVRRGKDVRNKTKILVTEFSVHPHFLRKLKSYDHFLEHSLSALVSYPHRRDQTHAKVKELVLPSQDLLSYMEFPALIQGLSSAVL